MADEGDGRVAERSDGVVEALGCGVRGVVILE